MMENSKSCTEYSKRLKKLMDENELELNDICKMLMDNDSAISSFSSLKTNPGINDLILIANFFNVSVDYLIGNSHHRLDATDMNNLNSNLYFYVYNILSKFAPISASELDKIENYIYFLVFNRNNKN